VPKAPRGRRPAPNPKKRTQRPVSRPVAVAPTDGQESVNGASATAVAPRPVRPARPSWTPAARRAGIAAVPRRRFSESVADYAYVPQDLRRIGLLVGGLLVLMVGLSFVIR
jgi:hypothetical protein